MTSPVGIHWASKSCHVLTTQILYNNQLWHLHYTKLSIFDNFKYCLALNSTVFSWFCPSAYPSEKRTTGLTCCRKHSNSWRSSVPAYARMCFMASSMAKTLTVTTHCWPCSSVLHFPKGPLMNKELNLRLFQTLNNKDSWATSQFHHAFMYV